MAKGLGTDIIEIGRIDKIISRYGHKFLDRLFTKKEQEYCLKHNLSSRHFAGRFAAKEAIVKALGTGINKDVNWIDIEILNDKNGRPFVTFSSHVADLFGNPEVQLSISHCKEYATAVAIRL